MERRKVARENAYRLVMALGKEEMVLYGYYCFHSGLNEAIDTKTRIHNLKTALAEYENQNYHDIAYAIYLYTGYLVMEAGLAK